MWDRDRGEDSACDMKMKSEGSDIRGAIFESVCKFGQDSTGDRFPRMIGMMVMKGRDQGGGKIRSDGKQSEYGRGAGTLCGGGVFVSGDAFEVGEEAGNVWMGRGEVGKGLVPEKGGWGGGGTG